MSALRQYRTEPTLVSNDGNGVGICQSVLFIPRNRFISDRPKILSPPAPARLQSFPSLRMGGLQANSGGVGWVEDASSTGSTLRLRQGERPLGPDSSKNQHPEAVFVSLF